MDKLEYLHTGSTLLNLALSNSPFGGWPIGWIVNVVGDKATGKTLLALEATKATQNILPKSFKKAHVIYNECEATLVPEYASLMGVQMDKVDMRSSATAEEFFNDVEDTISKIKDDKTFTLYILDSYDGLTTTFEQEDKDYDKGYVAAKKAAMLTSFLAKNTPMIKEKNMLLLILSQVRENLEGFGPKYRRAGGKAFDHRLSQIVWLTEKEKMYKARDARRPYGVKVVAEVKKNKAWKPYRQVQFDILFDYGIDDVGSIYDFLRSAGAIKVSGGYIEWKGKKYRKQDLLNHWVSSLEEYKYVVELTKRVWDKLEEEATIIRPPKIYLDSFEIK